MLSMPRPADWKRSHRGLSTIIGGMFMVIIMASALSVTAWSLREQDRVGQALTDKASSDLGRLNEKISISDVRISGNRLNVTVSNGGSAATLTSIYVVNKTASPNQQYRYDLGNIPIDGRNSVSNVGQSLPFIAKSNTEYSVKIVTAGGNTATTNIGSLAKTAMKLSMFVIPPTISPGANVTMLMSVTNNSTDSIITDPISARLTYTTACTPTQTYGCSVQFMEASGNGTSIARGSTAFFKWVYAITAPDNTSFNFVGSIVNGNAGNTVSGSVTVKLLDSARSGSSITTDVLSLKYLNNVGISLIAPGPFGTQGSSSQAVWGVIVSNPTSQTLGVSRVSISLSSPPASSGDNMVTATCPFTPIQPPSGTWSCPATNIVQWKAASGTTVDIQGFQSAAFIVAIPTGNIQSSEIPSAIITATAFTTYGQFSKSGYSTNMSKTGSAMANVYVSANVNSTTLSDIQGYRNAIPSGSTQTFKVVLTDFESSSTYKINSGARVIINLPPGWTNISICPTCYGGFSQPTITPFTDGSSQIKATRYSDITGSGTTTAGTITFTVTVPTVTAKRIYTMTLATDGTINSPSGFNLGAISEFPLQVDP
jgi:hypothetical protein